MMSIESLYVSLLGWSVEMAFVWLSWQREKFLVHMNMLAREYLDLLRRGQVQIYIVIVSEFFNLISVNTEELSYIFFF